ncbi:uncharacterized protein V6R79_016995 [Siganus canaliculatus]
MTKSSAERTPSAASAAGMTARFTFSRRGPSVTRPRAVRPGSGLLVLGPALGPGPG